MTEADITLIDELFAGRILSRKTVIIGNVLCLMPLVLMLVGLGLAGGAAYFGFAEDDVNGGMNPLSAGVSAFLVVIGIVIAAAAGYWGMRNVTKLANWYLRRVARREIKSRSDAIVDPDDPEALFVEIVPRRNWGKMMLETATDVGYLVVDERRREILFEGDEERMRIPGGAILSCKVEETIIGQGTTADMAYYFTIVRVQHGSGSRQLPFAYRGDLGQLGARTREQRALHLRKRIRAIME